MRTFSPKAKDITRVTIDRKQPTESKQPSESKLVFVRVDKDRWRLQEPYAAQTDGTQVERIGSQPIERVSRHAQDLPGANLVGGIPDKRWLRLFAAVRR